MSQTFNVVRCFQCSIYQVDIDKKSTKKWTCKLCGAKQTLKQVKVKPTNVRFEPFQQKKQLTIISFDYRFSFRAIRKIVARACKRSTRTKSKPTNRLANKSSSDQNNQPPNNQTTMLTMFVLNRLDLKSAAGQSTSLTKTNNRTNHQHHLSTLFIKKKKKNFD